MVVIYLLQNIFLHYTVVNFSHFFRKSLLEGSQLFPKILNSYEQEVAIIFGANHLMK